MKNCLLLFDGDDADVAEKLKAYLSRISVIRDIDVRWSGDIPIGSAIDTEMGALMEKCDIILYIFSSNTNLDIMADLSIKKTVFALYMTAVADFVIEYIKTATMVRIVPEKPIMEIGWYRGLSIAMQHIFGSHKNKTVILFWIPRVH